VIQGGHFGQGFAKAADREAAEKLGKKSRDTIKNEAKANGLSNLKGTLSMARLRAPDTASDQFFISAGPVTTRLRATFWLAFTRSCAFAIASCAIRPDTSLADRIS